MFQKLKTNISNLPKYLLKLTKKYSNRLIFGQNRSIFKGSGIEFVDIREYIEGDDPRYIDWNVSARMNELFVRNFQEEREIPIYVIIDLDSSLFFGTKSKLKIELLEELLAIVMNLSFTLSERFGAIVGFKNELAFFRPSKNFSETYKILLFIDNIIKDFKKNKDKYWNANSNIEKLLKIVNEYIKRTSTIIIFSSFVDIKSFEKIEKYLRTIKKIKNNEVFVFKLTDPSEINLPAIGRINIKDPFTQKISSIDITPKLVEEFRKEALNKINRINQICRRNNIVFINFSTSDNIENKIIEFLKRK
ncbi:MAG: DUF58 domain-containing protein [bacterium]|nr:DUF58 domain-containing protein [bacterium]